MGTSNNKQRNESKKRAAEYNIQNDPTPEQNEKYGEKSHKNS